MANIKLPGKAQWAERRRPMTRKSGYSTTGPGSQFEIVHIDGYIIEPGGSVTIEFRLPEMPAGEILGFGGWFWLSGSAKVTVADFGARFIITDFAPPDWNKFGSQWYSDGSRTPDILVTFSATDKPVSLALYGLLCGRVSHRYLNDARPELMTNMHAYAPEANFIDAGAQGKVFTKLVGAKEVRGASELFLKSCNRCGRLLPVNYPDERAQLSFSNHCVADQRRPCSHSGFGRLENRSDGSFMQLEYGFQLECRFCKKFEVNAAHNPQRTAGQMKEDAARRRALELLIEHLYAGSPQLRYRRETGRELADDVFRNFDGRCFKCGTKFAVAQDMDLDHTRPLALLWPLDTTATALCPTHNSEKRDRPPAEFYTTEELERLSRITGIPLRELLDPSPNLEAIRLLEQRIEWFCRVFLKLPSLARVSEGKLAADLLVKALQKTLYKVPGGAPFDIRKRCQALYSAS